MALLLALTVVGLPLAMALVYRWLTPFQPRTFSLDLSSDSIELDVISKHTLKEGPIHKRMRIKREALSRARAQVNSATGVQRLVVDVGIERYSVIQTTWKPLKAPELEWLAEVINTWKAQG